MTDFDIARQYLKWDTKREYHGYTLFSGGEWLSRYYPSPGIAKTKELDALLLSSVIQFMDELATHSPETIRDEFKSVARAKLVLLAVKGLV
jgi:hypothetical protein